MAGYLAARDVQFANPVGAFMGARDDAMKNALIRQQADAQMQQQQFSQNRLMQQDAIAAKQREQEAAAASAASSKDESGQVFTYLQHLSKAETPEKFAFLADRMAATPLFQKHNITREDLTPEDVKQSLPMFAAEAGVAPMAGPVWADEQGPRGSLLQRNSVTGEARQVVGQTPSQPAGMQRRFRTLSSQEAQAKGFPAGSVVQQDMDTGALEVVTKRDNTGTLSQKDLTTARMKLNTVALARQQLQRVKDAFSEGTKGVNAFGGAQGLLPTQKGKKFDAAVDQMRSTLTALTRVPGVGAMSDYETKLDQAKFPSRTGYETVTSDKIQGLEDMLSLIENGYKDLIGGQPQQPVGNNGWSVEVVP